MSRGDRRRARPRTRPSPARPRAAARTPRTCRGSTGPQPRIPAATAPCSDPGSAASVMRAATLVGIIPCSAIATSSRSRKKRWSSVGSRPGEQQVEVLGEAQPAHQVAGEVASSHLDPVGIGLADVADGRSRPYRSHAQRRYAPRARASRTTRRDTLLDEDGDAVADRLRRHEPPSVRVRHLGRTGALQIIGRRRRGAFAAPLRSGV